MSPRGGSRNATPGKSYSNRTDLGGQNVVGPQPTATGKVPIQTAPNQVQGEATAQRQAQRVIPMGGNPTTVQPPTQPQPQPSSPLTSLFASSARQDEPVTTGVDTGPGAGSSVLGLEQGIPAQYQTSKDFIQQLAQDPNASPAILQLAARINGAF